MTITRKLHESGTLAKSSTRGRFPIRIITEGIGSSGRYDRQMLESNASELANSAMFMNHPTDPTKPWERDVTSIAGKFDSPIEYKVVDGVAGLYTEALVDERWIDFVENYADHIGVSVFIAGSGKEDEDGNFLVESLDGNDPYKSCDFVVAAGRGGKVERMLESYRVIEASVGEPTVNGTATAVADEQRKRQNMDEATKAFIEALFSKVDEKFVALESKVDSIVTLSESATAAATAQVEALEVADKLAEAKLTENGRKRVIESVKGGTAIADAILAESALRDEYLAEANESAGTGRVVEGAASADFSVAGWGN